ncbi:hypothetical protein SLH46_16650 [Draconibacterium sp. IB214405]|uniref:hypothetical protein n=1 Tax=Draconibacterium sp. IB214405 TaxID=3097352 RepID=UPI002A17D194|nr:hypothetical protein [Draconibacterium sp. IB214405]MDX8340829.1 hypothetical protein [Draconibacterium sp. IB214405]
MMTTKSYIILFLLLISVLAKAQTGSLPHEKIDVHLSEQCLLVGDELWMSISVNNEQELAGKQISNLALVEFVSENNQSLVRKKILLTKGIGECSITVPDTIDSGIYYLMTYTNWSKNFGEGASNVSKIYVFNPAKTANVSVDTTAKQEAEITPVENEVIIKTQKSEYTSRERIDFSFQLKDEQLSPIAYSVSVAPVLSNLLNKELTVLTQSSLAVSDKIEYLPDYKGILLSGTLINKLNNETIPNQELVMSLPGDAVAIDFTTTDAQGKFEFLLEARAGSKDIVFNLPSNEAVIKFDESFVNGFEKTPERTALAFDEGTVDFLKRMFLYHQLGERFDQKNYKPASSSYASAHSSFYGEVYQKVYLKDFTELDSISEYFYELTPTVHFPKKRGEQELYLTNPETNFSLGSNPAVFIDGVYYPYFDDLAGLDYKLVEQINVIPKNYYYKNKVFNGIVSLYTHQKNFNEVFQPESMQRIIYPLTDASFSFGEFVPEKSSRVPDLRRLLHWEQNAWKTKGAEQKGSCYSSDITGDYQINVRIVTASGEVVKGAKQIRVK